MKQSSRERSKLAMPYPCARMVACSQRFNTCRTSAGVYSMMIEITDESGDGAFEIDVVFPQRVVCIDQKGLRREGRRAKHLSASSHG